MKPSPIAKAALDQYRRSLLPDGEARERALRQLFERAAMGEVPSPPPAPRPPSLRLIRRQPAFTTVVASGLCMLALVAAWFGRTQQPAADQSAEVRPQTPAMDEGTRAESSAVLQPTAAEPRSPREIDAKTPRAKKRARAVGTRSNVASEERKAAAASSGAGRPNATPPLAPRSVATATGAVEHSALEEEVRLIGLAHDALRAGQPERALARLAEHAARFPQGELAHSRRMTRIMALCQAGHVAAARSEAQDFLARSANSPYAARVRSLCPDLSPATR